MPSEIIYAESDAKDAFDIHITWSPDQHLQVGLVTRDGTPIGQKFNLYVGDQPPTATTNSGVDHSSVWATLNWPGVNALIRKLRRARDDVWGSAA